MTKKKASRVFTITPATHLFRLPHVPKAKQLRSKIKVRTGTNPVTPNIDNADFLAMYAGWRSQYPGGSILEYIVWYYLTTVKKWQNHYEFEYQYPALGGRSKYGGYVVDFFIPLGQLAWDVNGLRYHLTNPIDRAKVMVEAALLAHRGIKLINLWEDDLIWRTDYVIKLALVGMEAQTHTKSNGMYA